MIFYVLDDDINVIKILRDIIEENYNHQVIGYHSDPRKAVHEILVMKPDVVLVDYLMPFLDGVDVIQAVKQRLDVIFVMISQVSDKEMIGKAYLEGLSFFISKPINKLEVTGVLKNVTSHLNTQRKLRQIKSLIGETSAGAIEQRTDTMKSALKNLGIYSEKGSKDVLNVLEILQQRHVSVDVAIHCYADAQGEKSKILRQRMRRAVVKGLRNLAYLGLEDYMNELFISYSSQLYDFENVKKEMDYIRGKSSYKGTVSLDRFLSNLKEF